MDTEKKDYYTVDKVQEKNQEELESYKELLKKELESIRTLVSTETNDENAIESSNLNSENLISQAEYEKLLEENRTLKSEKESLTYTNSMLENDNRLLRENNDALKLQNSNITELENEITTLKEVILNLEKEKLELTSKETVEIPKQEVLSSQDIPIDISNEIKSIFGNEESTETITPPVHKGYTIPPIKPKKFRRKTTPKPEKITPQNNKSIPDGESTTYSQLDSEKIIEETVRRKCPTCFNTNKKFIRELTDKSNILMHYPRIYGKKYKCGICRTEWK